MTHTEEFKEEIARIRKLTLAGAMPLAERIEALRVASDRYALKHAELNDQKRAKYAEQDAGKNAPPREIPYNPPSAELLERCADLIMHEDLTDNTAWKSRQSEYPVLSELQLARRRDGVHQRKNEGGSGEVSFKEAETVSTGGRDYRVPTRRKRSYIDNAFVDENAKIRNKARRERYEEFTGVQPVITYKLSEGRPLE